MHFCASIYDHGQINAWFDHALRTQGIFDEPHIQLIWRESRVQLLGQTQKIHLETRHLSKSPTEKPRFPNLHCCSQGLTDQVVPLQVAMKPELTSTQLAQKRKSSLGTILPSVADSFFSTLLAPIPFTARLFAFVALAAGLRIRTFCVRICTCPLERKCPWQSVYKESLRCLHLCGHLWHPFPPQPSWVSVSITAHPAALRSMAEYSFPGSLGASKPEISCTLLRSLITPVTDFRDCITVFLMANFQPPATP